MPPHSQHSKIRRASHRPGCNGKPLPARRDALRSLRNARRIARVRNARAYHEITFRPRCAVAVKNYDMKTTVLGTDIDMPIILAPVGSSRMFYPRGEEVAAKVAGEFGTIYTKES